MTCITVFEICVMGRHTEWRKIAKKLRRKRIRSKNAEERNEIERREREKRESSPSYLSCLKEQEALEEFIEQEEQRLAEERQRQWEYQEIEDQRRWREQLARLEKARAEKVKQELRIREEWEREQTKIKEEKEKKEKEAEEKRKTQEELLAQIDAFISGKAELPASSIVGSETQPGQPECPFFAKTGACRFRNHCSRNHVKPGISRILLFTNFYESFIMNTSSNSMNNEYDTDVGLEYEDSDTYRHFQDFYDDILPEFENCGKLRQLKVCCNYEPHLRGNVYVEYYSKRHALKAYRLFQGRYYAGRQLSVSFANIPSWKNALCGLFRKQRCPKGRTCNFLHTFRNPFNAFRDADFDSPRHNRESPPIRTRTRSPENWRWSESSGGSGDESKKTKWDPCRNEKKYREKGGSTERRRVSAQRKRIRRKRSRSRSRSQSDSEASYRSRNSSSNHSKAKKSKHKERLKTENRATKAKTNRSFKMSSSDSNKSNSRTSLTDHKKKSEKEERTPGSG